MQIEHIFNAVNPKTNHTIPSQEFEVGYWKNTNENYNPPDDDKLAHSDFAQMYYNPLVSSDKDKIISRYDDDKLKRLTSTLGDNLLLISGDFWGIQKFIFDGITASKASKILRSRSAMVQLITYAVVDSIKQVFPKSEALLFGAGKFMILAKEEKEFITKIDTLQKELDSYFLRNFFGQNGFILSSTTTTREKLLNQQNMEDDLLNLGRDNDIKKLNKFDLLICSDDDILIDPFKVAQIDDAICEFCNKRIKSHNVDDNEACAICFNQIELGKQLTKKPYLTIFKSSQKEPKETIEIIKLGSSSYYAKFEEKVTIEGDSFDIDLKKGYHDYPKWSLNSYVATDENGEIKTFDKYVEKSSGLMALKADIDKLGDTFRELYKEDFRKFNRLSREVEFFFSDYITSLVAKKENVYTVFAGGDDLFLIGEYREIVSLAKEIRDEFYNFSLEKTTISMGLVMFKPSTPIHFVSNMADEAEKRAKIERDSIDIFGISMKFDEFCQIEEKFFWVIKYLKKNKVDTTTLYYRLIELCDMRENLSRALNDKDHKFNPNDAMWKSKLNYLFVRNIKEENNDSEIFETINQLIEEGEKFKPSLFLQIYRNRDKK